MHHKSLIPLTGFIKNLVRDSLNRYISIVSGSTDNKRIKAEQEVILALYYRGIKPKKDFRLDILVENEVIREGIHRYVNKN